MPQEETDFSDFADADFGATEQLTRFVSSAQVPQLKVSVVEGPSSGQTLQTSGARFCVGSHPSNDLVLDDRSVSRFHCEFRLTPRGVWLHDLESSNGTTLDGVAIGSGRVREGSLVVCGHSTLQLHLGESVELPVSSATSFGELVGVSIAMRSTFAVLERAAATDVTVLLEGETGTGKEGAAEALHSHSPRKDGPFVVVDCSALPANLLESELFGHEKGAFTGALSRREGAFQQANGGTVFLDEIGELPPELQPKLLRALEQRQVRPVGGSSYQRLDVRVIAATNRDLRQQVNDGTFRSDVYYRLAVVKVTLPPLRERPEDVAPLIERFQQRLGVGDEVGRQLFDADFVERARRATWPGNVRELRNFLERCIVMQQALPVAAEDDGVLPTFQVDPRLSYSESKRRIVSEFERRYVTELHRLHLGNVSKAARAAEMDRPYLHKLLQRHGLKT